MPALPAFLLGQFNPPPRHGDSSGPPRQGWGKGDSSGYLLLTPEKHVISWLFRLKISQNTTNQIYLMLFSYF